MFRRKDNLRKLLRIIKAMGKKKVLTIGDLMLDRYIWGAVSRISPEAPVQVVEMKRESNQAGGAGNVAVNITSLEGETAIIGIVGEDKEEEILTHILKEDGVITEGILKQNVKPTITKTRIIAQGQQLIRIDHEERGANDGETEGEMIIRVKERINWADAVVISDYGKGAISKGVMRTVINECRKANKPLIIDPKPSNIMFYKGAFLITPNHREACLMAGVEETNGDGIEKVGRALTKKLRANILITRGEQGMSLFTKDNKVMHIPSKAREVYDVTGAGDTVVAAIAMAISAGARLEEAAIISNYAAGVTVAKVGTGRITPMELAEAIRKDK